IIVEVTGMRIEIDLKPLQIVAGCTPLVEASADPGIAAIWPRQGIDADDHPHLLERQMRRLWPQRDIMCRAAVADLAVEQIEDPRALELGLGRHSGPQPEGVVFARVDPVGVAARSGAERQRQDAGEPYQ